MAAGDCRADDHERTEFMSAFKNWRGRTIVLTLASLLAIIATTAAFAQSGPGKGRGAAPSAPSGRDDIVRPPPPPDGHSSVACGGDLAYPDSSGFADAGDAVKAVSRVASNYLKACDCPATSCLADVLDSYARELAKIAPRLPPQLRDMPAVVATAARRVRHAHSKAEAEADSRPKRFRTSTRRSP